MVSTVLKDSVTVFKGGVAWCKEDASVRGERVSMLDDPSIIAL